MSKKYSFSNQLIKNTKDFLNIKHYSFLHKLLGKTGVFYGWGRKKSGQKAIELAKKHNTSFVLLEDGFIRSLDLGIKGSPSFSIVQDDIGIYYDATTPSRLEYILQTYDFDSDVSSNTVEVYIHHLRAKRGKDFIRTIRGLGYRLG